MTAGNRVLLFACWTMLWSVCSRAIFFVLVPVVSRDLGLDTHQASALVVVASTSAMAGFWLSGYLKGSRLALIGIGVVVSVVSALALQVISRYAVLVAATVALFVGAAQFYSNGVTLVSDFAAPHLRARNIAAIEMSGAASFMLAAFATAPLLLRLGWRQVLLLAVGGTGLISLALLMWVRTAVEQPPGPSVSATSKGHHRPGEDGKGNRGLLLRWGVALTGPYTVVAALMGLLPLMLTERARLSPGSAATFLGFMRLSGLVSPPLVAGMARRYGAYLVLAGAYGTGFLALGALGLLDYGWLYAGTMAVMMVAVVGTPTLVTTLALESAGSDPRRFISGTITFAKLLGESLMPAILAGLFARGTAPIFWAVALAVAVSGFQVMQLGRQRAVTVPGR